jgi:hypothetical protein
MIWYCISLSVDPFAFLSRLSLSVKTLNTVATHA